MQRVLDKNQTDLTGQLFQQHKTW